MGCPFFPTRSGIQQAETPGGFSKTAKIFENLTNPGKSFIITTMVTLFGISLSKKRKERRNDLMKSTMPNSDSLFAQMRHFRTDLINLRSIVTDLRRDVSRIDRKQLRDASSILEENSVTDETRFFPGTKIPIGEN